MTAEDIFEELGWEKEETPKELTYKKQYSLKEFVLTDYIVFDYKNKCIETYSLEDDYGLICRRVYLTFTDVRVVAAIQKQLEELGW